MMEAFFYQLQVYQKKNYSGLEAKNRLLRVSIQLDSEKRTLQQ